MGHDVIIIGLGAMGSAAAYHTAKRGARVVGIDQFDPPHSSGSSHGETRVIREAYFEHPVYVPLVQRAYELWSELEKESGQQLYLKTGGLMIGDPDGMVVRGSIQSAKEHRLPHEVLVSSEIKRRFPGLNPNSVMQGVLEPRAGILYAEKCVAAHLSQARKCQAILRPGETVISWEERGDHVLVTTDQNEYRGSRLIVTAGPWTGTVLPRIAPLLKIERQVLLWFKAREPSLFTPDRFPIHLWEYGPDKMFYGFPDLGTGVKVAFHHQGEWTDAKAVNREVKAEDIESMRTLLQRFLPHADGEFLRGTVCLYTNTPDGHFILDFLPRSNRVIVASPCSGHGFKFASAVGELLADLALDGTARYDLSLFRLSRFEE